MGPKKVKLISEEALSLIHQAACIQMNLSDAYFYLSYLYIDDCTATGFGAYAQDKASMNWFYAQNILKYIIGRGNKVCIPDIQYPCYVTVEFVKGLFNPETHIGYSKWLQMSQRPEIDTQGRIQCATAVLNMERELTGILHRLLDLSLDIKDDRTLKYSKDLIYQQQRDEERMAREVDELKKREQAQKEAVEDEICSPPKMPRREPSDSK